MTEKRYMAQSIGNIIRVKHKNGVYSLHTSLGIKYGFNCVEVRWRDKNGVYCKYISNEIFRMILLKCVEDSTLEFDEIIKNSLRRKYDGKIYTWET